MLFIVNIKGSLPLVIELGVPQHLETPFMSYEEDD